MNKLPLQKRAQILHLLCEGNSLRGTARLADVAYNSVLKLAVDAGKACNEYQYKTLQNLSCKKLQLDEIWSFCYSKQKNTPLHAPDQRIFKEAREPRLFCGAAFYVL